MVAISHYAPLPQRQRPPSPHAGRRVEPGQESFIRAVSPLSQHVTSMLPTGMQSPPNLGQDTGPHAPPGASRPGGAHPYVYSNGDK